MVYELDPLTDTRWVEFLQGNMFASAFHSPGWLRALRDTYGFMPTVLTTSSPGSQIRSGIVFCRIHSWLTGSRLVSLPYSDHCEPLGEPADLDEILAWAASECRRCGYKYVEVRPLRAQRLAVAGLHPTDRFVFHSVDLHRDKEEIYAAFDKKCVQGRIRRATKEALVWELGRAEPLVDSFYHLIVLTRQRHQLPPQPIQWYRNLIACMGDAVTIHLLRKGDRAIAGILTIGYKHSLIAKYSCSDQDFKNIGATPLLFWRVIERAKASGFVELDLGRCNLEDEGLSKFKTRLGASSSGLVYWRYAEREKSAGAHNWTLQLAKQVFSYMPQSLLSTSGRVLYRHFG